MAAPVAGMAAWGLVTGVAMVKSGLTVVQALGMSLFVFAGSAQLASLPLIVANAPIWVILLTAFCVNLRFVIFSAQWRNYFGALPRLQRLAMMYVAGDVTFVNFVRRFPKPNPGPNQLEYFWGSVACNWAAWQGASVIGIVLADQVPTQWGLSFAGVLALLGLTYSLTSGRVLWIVAAVAAVVSVLTYALPLRLNIVCTILVAGGVGWWLDRRKAL